MKQLSWWVMMGLGLSVGFGSLSYVCGDPALFDEVFRAKYTANRALIMTHGIASVLALLVGPWQFGRLHRWHRKLGYLYLLSLLLGALTGLPMAAMAEGGWMARLGFATVDVLWLGSAWMALRTARLKRFRQHRQWMVRSYALTFGAVVLRLVLYGLQHLGYEFNAIYPYTPWLSWLASLAVAEWILEGENPNVRVPRYARPEESPGPTAGLPVHVPAGLHSGGHSASESVPLPNPQSGRRR